VFITGTHDSVNLPVTNSFTGLDDLWSFRDVAFIGQYPSGILRVMFLSTLLGRLSQMLPKVAAFFAFPADIVVDGLVTDGEEPTLRQGP